MSISVSAVFPSEPFQALITPASLSNRNRLAAAFPPLIAKPVVPLKTTPVGASPTVTTRGFFTPAPV